MKTITLFRPVNEKELELIKKSDFKEFPPRLSGQPFFYPVCNRDYACQISKEWNVKQYGKGYVTRFQVNAKYLEKFCVKKVGSTQHLEYWIPAKELAEFNENIIGKIDVIDEFSSNKYAIDPHWEKIYDLAEDTEAIMMVQRATLDTEEYGLIPEVAVYGTPEWWKAIDDGRIPLYVTEGIITRVFMTSHRDWPSFEVIENGVSTKWTSFGDPLKYAEGKKVRVEYVMQKAKKHWIGKQEHEEVIRIFIRD